MEKKLYCMCENTYSAGDILELYGTMSTCAPFYEDVSLGDGNDYGVASLLECFCMMGERSYFSLETEHVKEHLVRVKQVDARIVDERVLAKYTFENGDTYELDPETFIVDDTLSLAEAEKFLEAVKAAAHHLFYLSCKETEDMFAFEYERWG